MRPTCVRCRRPTSFCVCRELPVLHARTRVVLLQHPREARLAICSAWLTRAALANCELHRGFCFERDERVRAALTTPGATLLYPGEAGAPGGGQAAPPVLVVIDGTWVQAEKMLAANPKVAALPRLSLSSERRSGYRELRREPAPHYLSTIEAVATALGLLEGDAARFAPMFDAFARLVERQLACAHGERRNPRHRPSRAGAPTSPLGAARRPGG